MVVSTLLLDLLLVGDTGDVGVVVLLAVHLLVAQSTVVLGFRLEGIGPLGPPSVKHSVDVRVVVLLTVHLPLAQGTVVPTLQLFGSAPLFVRVIVVFRRVVGVPGGHYRF